MDKFTLIDMKTWERAEIYRLYTETWGTVCYSVTDKVDVTETVRHLKERGQKFVPGLIYVITREINSQRGFRTTPSQDGNPGYWNVVHPLIPVLNKNKVITYHTLRWEEDKTYAEFYEDYLYEADKYKDSVGAYSELPPPNYYVMSVMPFLSFTSDAIYPFRSKYFFLPTVVAGKYTEENGRLMMPVSISTNHAIADGYQLSLFFSGLRNAFLYPEEWCK